MAFDELQKQAVVEAARCGLLILTGGPGTGKTTTINAVIRYFEHEEMTILLAAPTGRAAKRMTEATGREAKTIHRLLEITGIPTDENGKSNELSGMHFERNEEMPLEADCVIIDEMSMVDIHLMSSLLKAVSVGTHLILVGDVNQLPSVGPGNVLRDMIDSDCFSVVRLNRIYRQAAESDIIVNAHKMIRQEPIDLAKRSRDFLFIRQDGPEQITRTILTLLKDKLPPYVRADAGDIQVMTPMRKGPLGVEHLNEVLREALNPQSPRKTEKELNGILFRTGDKVMQTKNDYHRGVYNGDIGIIREINLFAELLTVEFDEQPAVEYSFGDADELEPAYAITIHKSQGSEYPAVIVPVWQGPRMLLTRNLIYTAVTRARICAALVGAPEYFYEMVNNTQELKRNTGLGERIREICS
jgi:exodeoxyribonuclease V alpha subunit